MLVSCNPNVSLPAATSVMLLMSNPPGLMVTSRPSSAKKPFSSAT